MKKDPVGLFFKYFVWASVAVVVLAVLTSSGARRLGRIMQAEFGTAVEENRQLGRVAMEPAKGAPAVPADEIQVVAKRDQAGQIELTDEELEDDGEEPADENDFNVVKDLPEKDNEARPQPLDEPANAPNVEKPKNEVQANEPPPERAQKKITPERISGYRTSLKKGVVQTERANAAKAIGEMGPQVAGQVTRDLCAALVDKHVTVRQAASEALERVNPEFRKIVLPIALDENPTLRTKHIKELTEMGIRGSDALPVVVFRLNVLSKLLWGNVSYTREMSDLRTQAATEMPDCLACLYAIGKDDQDVCGVMMTVAAKGALLRTRAQALAYLPGMKIEDTKRAVSILTNAVRVDENENKIIAMKSLAKFGSEARSAIDVVRAAKGSTSAAVRDAATDCLSAIEKTPGGKKKKR